MSSTSFDRRMENAVRRVRAATRLPVAFAGTAAHGTLTLGQVAGQDASPLNGVRLDIGYGLGGQVMALRRPLAVADYCASTSIRHRYDHIIRASALRAMVAVPIVVRRKQAAVLYAAHPSGMTFGSPVLDAIATEARELEQELAVDDALAASESSIRAGLPSHSIEDLYGELRTIASRVKDPAVRTEVLAATARLFAENHPGGMLTERETDVLALIARGHSNARIADALGLTVHTVKGYVKTIMQKLGAETRYEAVFNARRQRLIP